MRSTFKIMISSNKSSKNNESSIFNNQNIKMLNNLKRKFKKTRFVGFLFSKKYFVLFLYLILYSQSFRASSGQNLRPTIC